MKMDLFCFAEFGFFLEHGLNGMNGLIKDFKKAK